jgi:antibiotic biosynthesis monooxygenase (ABM) superfamily enzyme
MEIVLFESASAGEYRTVYRFDTDEHLRAWLDSEERAAWLECTERRAPAYKMALLTWITIFPLITFAVVALDPLLAGLALVPRLALTTAVTVPIMTWLVMPRLTRLLHGWLYPHASTRPGTRPRALSEEEA